MKICYFCSKGLHIERSPGFRDLCVHCSKEIHICRNCRFFDENYYNKCREPKAEWVSDREKANYCEYFEFKESSFSARQAGSNEDAMKKWNKLFSGE
ncbi:MAG TPA: hypothetical protein VII00_00170 [bacterium]